MVSTKLHTATNEIKHRWTAAADETQQLLDEKSYLIATKI